MFYRLQRNLLVSLFGFLSLFCSFESQAIPFGKIFKAGKAAKQVSTELAAAKRVAPKEFLKNFQTYAKKMLHTITAPAKFIFEIKKDVYYLNGTSGLVLSFIMDATLLGGGTVGTLLVIDAIKHPKQEKIQEAELQKKQEQDEQTLKILTMELQTNCSFNPKPLATPKGEVIRTEFPQEEILRLLRSSHVFEFLLENAIISCKNNENYKDLVHIQQAFLNPDSYYPFPLNQKLAQQFTNAINLGQKLEWKTPHTRMG